MLYYKQICHGIKPTHGWLNSTLQSLVKWSLKIWDFLQMGIQLVIGFIYLFKSSLGKKFNVLHWSIFFGSLSEEEDLRTKSRALCWSTNSDERHKFYLFSFQFLLWTKFYFLECWCSLAMNTQFIFWVILFLIFPWLSV